LYLFQEPLLALFICVDRLVHGAQHLLREGAWADQFEIGFIHAAVLAAPAIGGLCGGRLRQLKSFAAVLSVSRRMRCQPPVGAGIRQAGLVVERVSHRALLAAAVRPEE